MTDQLKVFIDAVCVPPGVHEVESPNAEIVANEQTQKHAASLLDFYGRHLEEIEQRINVRCASSRTFALFNVTLAGRERWSP